MRARRRINTDLTLAAVAVIGVWSGARWTGGTSAAGECSLPGEPVSVSADTSTSLRLTLNVPAYRLDVVEQGQTTRSISVAVGHPRYRTPLGHFRVDYAVWNPWWRPPASAWARKERPKAPGWSNPVGRVKMHVTGLVFLHGTPLEGSLGTAASHACVRMTNDDAIALARLIHAHAGPPMPPTLIDELVADTLHTRTLVLTRSVPVDIEYVLAEVSDTDLVLYFDVYRYAGKRVAPVEEQAMRVLRAIVADTSDIDLARLRELARSARRATVRLPLDSLLRVNDATTSHAPPAPAR